MRKYDLISTLFWLLVGVFIVREGHIIHVGTLREPGPGFFLFWAGVVLCGLSAITFIKAQFSEEREFKKIWAGIKWHKPLLVLIISLLYAFFLVRLGYLLSTILLMLFLFRLADFPKWPRVLLFSFSSVLFSWVLFDFWLQCQFPKGPLENLIIYLLKLRY